MSKPPKNWPASKVESWPLERIAPYARNARLHSEEQILQVAESIRQFGWTVPLLVDEKGTLIAGHCRVEAAKRLKITEAPVMVARGWSEEQRRAYVIADNKLALNSSWDPDALRSELQDLRALGFDLQVIGFNEQELTELFAAGAGSSRDPDALPDVQKAVVSAAGDVWTLGRHRVLCGDSTSQASVGALMAGEFADICWTDPPYNVAYKTAAGEIANDDLTDSEFLAFLRAVFGVAFEVMMPGGCIYVAHADTEGLNFRAAFKAAGFKLSGCLIWEKDSLVLGRSDYQWQHEPILYGWKPGARHRWLGGRKQTTIATFGEYSPFERVDENRWQLRVGDRIFVVDGQAEVQEFAGSVIAEKKPKRNAEHPTMKPVALIERMLKNHVRAGDKILDLFGGSGSTLIAAERLNCNARLVELSPVYADVIVRRWQEFTGEKAVRERDGALFDSIKPVKPKAKAA